MAAETQVSQEILKHRYIDPVEKAVPETNVLQSNIKFDENAKSGDDIKGAIMLRLPSGFTFNAKGTAYNLNGARTGLTKQVTVVPSSFVLQEQISYDLAAACNGEQAAFSPELRLIIQGMVEAASWALELQMLYGGTHIGSTTTAPVGSSPTADFTITQASWSPWIWAPFEGGLVDAYSDAALTTKVNTNGPITINYVNQNTRVLNLTFFNGTDYTAATTAITAGGIWYVPYNANGGWAKGVDSLISTSAAGGTVFGLNTSQYTYMQSSIYNGGNTNQTFASLAKAAIGPANKGAMGEDLDVLVNTFTWTDIMNDQAALRQYQNDYKGEFENGATTLTYWGPNGGALRFHCDPMVKAGEAFILSFDDWKNVGATLPTFNLPNRDPQNPSFLMELPGVAGYEIRRYYQIATYCQRLARQAKITNIVNTTAV